MNVGVLVRTDGGEVALEHRLDFVARAYGESTAAAARNILAHWKADASRGLMSSAGIAGGLPDLSAWRDEDGLVTLAPERRVDCQGSDAKTLALRLLEEYTGGHVKRTLSIAKPSKLAAAMVARVQEDYPDLRANALHDTGVAQVRVNALLIGTFAACVLLAVTRPGPAYEAHERTRLCVEGPNPAVQDKSRNLVYYRDSGERGQLAEYMKTWSGFCALRPFGSEAEAETLFEKDTRDLIGSALA